MVFGFIAIGLMVFGFVAFGFGPLYKIEAVGDLRLSLRIFAIASLALFGVPLQWLFLKLGGSAQYRFPMLFHRGVARILDLEIRVIGCPAPQRPLLLTANHVSWLDIVVLGATVPVSFIAKAEIADWGIFGTFAKLQRSVFVDRNRRSETKNVNAAIAQRLVAGDMMVLFGEGTTGDGIRILPFRSALIGAAHEAAQASAEGQPVFLQPVSIAYTRLNGLPASRFDRAHTAWYGDMTLVPHLRQIVGGGPIDVTLSFGAAFSFADGAGRKQLTRKLEAEVRAMTVEAHNGREPESARQ